MKRTAYVPESRAQPRVLHFIRRWLPLSEPFVYDLVTKSRYSGPVVAICPFENSELFTYEPLLSLDWLKRRKVLGRRQKATTLALIYIARRHGVRLVHVHHGYGADDAVGVCRRLGLPMVLSLHGHVHESAGATRIGRTLCVNPGSDYHTGRISGCLFTLRGDQVRHQFVTG